MTPIRKRRTPFTQRLAEDMTIRNLASATINAYTYHVNRLSSFWVISRLIKQHGKMSALSSCT